MSQIILCVVCVRGPRSGIVGFCRIWHSSSFPSFPRSRNKAGKTSVLLHSPLSLTAEHDETWLDELAWTAPNCTIAHSSLLPTISSYIPFCSWAPGLHLFVSCSNVKDLPQTLRAVPGYRGTMSPGHSSYPTSWCLWTIPPHYSFWDFSWAL